MKRIALFLFLIVGLASACSKDEMETKKQDISRTWKVTKIVVNGTDETEGFNMLRPDYRYTINKDGSYTITDPALGGENGKWEFNEDGSKLIINKGSNDEHTIDVLELTSETLKIKTKTGNDIEEYTFEQA